MSCASSLLDGIVLARRNCHRWTEVFAGGGSDSTESRPEPTQEGEETQDQKTRINEDRGLQLFISSNLDFDRQGYNTQD